MASAPIKFRCFRCNQLLGVSRSKAGAVVACPKCQIELVVPEPEETAERPPATSSTGSTDGGISLDVLNIRPEDIRVEPGLRAPVPEPPPLLASDPVETAFPSLTVEEPISAEEVPWPAVHQSFATTRYESPAQVPAPAPAPAHILAPAPVEPDVPRQAVVRPRHSEEFNGFPAIQIDAPVVTSRSRSPMNQARSIDLVLPRSVVAAWSLLVLLAVAFGFTAGLLAGHYVWRVH